MKAPIRRMLWAALFLGFCQIPTGFAEETSHASRSAESEEAPAIRVVLGFSTRYFEQDEQGRVEVRRIIAGGPAQRAGLRSGDVITTVNGLTFRFENEWHWMRSLGWMEPGIGVDLGIERDGETRTVRLVPDPATPVHQRAFAEHLAKLERCFTSGDCDGCLSSSEPRTRIVRHPRMELDRQILASGGRAEMILYRDANGELGLTSDDVEIDSAFVVEDDRSLKDFGRRLDRGEAIRVRITVTDQPRLQSDTSTVGHELEWPIADPEE